MENKEMSAPDLLKAAARLVDRALAQLDTGGDKCKCCGLVRYSSGREMRAHRRLAGTPDKLRNEAEHLASGR